MRALSSPSTKHTTTTPIKTTPAKQMAGNAHKNEKKIKYKNENQFENKKTSSSINSTKTTTPTKSLKSTTKLTKTSEKDQFKNVLNNTDKSESKNKVKNNANNNLTNNNKNNKTNKNNENNEHSINTTNLSLFNPEDTMHSTTKENSYNNNKNKSIYSQKLSKNNNNEKVQSHNLSKPCSLNVSCHSESRGEYNNEIIKICSNIDLELKYPTPDKCVSSVDGREVDNSLSPTLPNYSNLHESKNDETTGEDSTDKTFTNAQTEENNKKNIVAAKNVGKQDNGNKDEKTYFSDCKDNQKDVWNLVKLSDNTTELESLSTAQPNNSIQILGQPTRTFPGQSGLNPQNNNLSTVQFIDTNQLATDSKHLEQLTNDSKNSTIQLNNKTACQSLPDHDPVSMTREELRDGLRVLYLKDQLFVEATIKNISPPDM